jgi:hypothetical protein
MKAGSSTSFIPLAASSAAYCVLEIAGFGGAFGGIFRK